MRVARQEDLDRALAEAIDIDSDIEDDDDMSQNANSALQVAKAIVTALRRVLNTTRTDYERLDIVREELNSIRIHASTNEGVEDWPDEFHEFVNDPFTYLYPDDNLREALADRLDIALDVIHSLEAILDQQGGNQQAAKVARLEMPYLFYDDDRQLNEVHRYILCAIQDKVLEGNAVSRLWKAVMEAFLTIVHCTPQLQSAAHRRARMLLFDLCRNRETFAKMLIHADARRRTLVTALRLVFCRYLLHTDESRSSDGT